MPSTRVHLPTAIPGWDALRAELQVPGDFPSDVLAEADAVRPQLPEHDLRNVSFLTIDPVGSTDLDQAMALSRTETGYQVLYAIADVAAFAASRAPSTWRRTCAARPFTHRTSARRCPPVLCEDRASLLADQDRPALVWALPLDTEAVLQHTDVRRAVIRSRRKLDYPGVQAMIDDGSATPDLQLLKEIGQLRQADARRRDAVDLPTPEQEVDTDGNLTYRAQLPCKQWNAQLSLLTGMAAAKVMLDGGVGLLRTLPAPDPQSVDSLRRSALALGVAWPEGTAYGDVLSGLDPSQPAAAALLTLATRLLRGAVYTAFDGTLLELHTHSAVAAPYAHCMAPLRRLAARYVGEVCLALCAGTEIPSWARQALPALPAEMATADHRAHALDRAVVDLAEAMVLQHRVGQGLHGVVVEADHHGGTVQITDPAVRGKLDGQMLPLGQTVDIVLIQADPLTWSVRFRLA